MSRYHQRSNVETDFSMVKAKFGDTLTSKTDTAQRNEALLKMLAHNVVVVGQSVHEIDLAPTFWEAGSS